MPRVNKHDRSGRRDWQRLAIDAAAFVGCVYIFVSTSTAQNVPAAGKSDPIIAAIAIVKHSVGSMDCLAVSGTDAKILKRIGTAFLISQEADFLTAAHVVIAMQRRDDPCPTPAITLAVRDWRPDAPVEQMLWFPFRTADCRVDRTTDVAKCRPSGNLPSRIRDSRRALPLEFAYDIQPDGGQVGFTGFPLEERDPMTFRAHVAAYKTPSANRQTPELILDHVSLPGFSGSPVFLADGKVIAILLRDGTPEAPGISIARPVSAFREMIGDKPDE